MTAGPASTGPPAVDETVAAVGTTYAAGVTAIMTSVVEGGAGAVAVAAGMLADCVADDRLIHVFGPGAHSNLAAQEIFYRPGSLMHVSPILDPGTLLSAGALRSTDAERSPGYGADVIRRTGLVEGDVLILVNAFGVNSAVIDAALTAERGGVTTVGVSSRRAAETTPANHPARHPDRLDLHDVVDVHLDSHVPAGETLLDRGREPSTGAVSTLVNAFCLQWLMASAIAVLDGRGVASLVWSSRNTPGGDEANARGVERLRHRVRLL